MVTTEVLDLGGESVTVVVRDWTEENSAALVEAMASGGWVSARRFRPPFGGLAQVVDVLVYGSASESSAGCELLAYRVTPAVGEDVVVQPGFRLPLVRLVNAVAAGGGEPVSLLGFGWWSDEP